MRALKPFIKPTKEELVHWTVEQGQDADAKNAEIAKENHRLLDLAKLIAEEIEPTNRHIRGLEPLRPPLSIAKTIQKMIEEREEREREEKARKQKAH